MAGEQLTPKQRMSLAMLISAKDWVQIAEVYFELGDGVIKNIKANNPGDAESQSKDMITKWMNKNSENQVKVCLILITLWYSLIISLITKEQVYLMSLVTYRHFVEIGGHIV